MRKMLSRAVIYDISLAQGVPVFLFSSLGEYHCVLLV